MLCENLKSSRCRHDWGTSPEAGGILRPSCKVFCPLSNDCWKQCVCFGEINRSWLTRTEAEGNTCCFCSVRPREVQHAPASLLGRSGNGFLVLG